MKKIIKNILLPLWKFRFSLKFKKLRDLFSYSPSEQMYMDVMGFAEASKLEGDYLEFGIAEGNSMSVAFHCARLCGLTKMKFYGFDSFEGLPAISGVDAQGFRAFEKGLFAHGVGSVRKNMRRKGVDLSFVSFVPGYYDASLTPETKRGLAIRKAAVVMVDCDLYESTVPVLDFITDYIQDGTVIIFDDWFCFRADPRRGEQRAFREWLAKNPSLSATEFRRYSTGGNSFIIHKQ